MLAKKRFFQADKAVREAADYSRAVKLYDEGFAAWKRVLAQKQDCRRRRASDPAYAHEPCRDFRDLDRPMEEVYELNVRYSKLAQDVRANELRDAMVQTQDLVRYAGAGTTGNMFHGLGNLGVWYALVPQFKAVGGLPLPGPMDGVDQDGQPWMPDQIKMRVREKLGLVRRTMPVPPGGPPGGGPGLTPLPPPSSPGR